MHPSSSALSALVLTLAMTGALAACGGSVEETGKGDGADGTDKTSPPPAGPTFGNPQPAPGNGPGSAPPKATTCTYPVITNPPECPPAYTRQPPPSCAPIGLKCWYPGAGDGTPDGCWATALLSCVGPSDADGGEPTTGTWIGAQ
jgi:hypothetical protein